MDKDMEYYLKKAVNALDDAQKEILFPCELYSQIDGLINSILTMIDDKVWDSLQKPEEK